LIRVRDAMALVGWPVDDAELTAAEAETLRQLTAELVAARSPMTIDGAAVTPDFDRAAYMRIGLFGLEIIEPAAAIDVNATILGLIYAAPTDGLPQEATVEWTLFTDRIREVPANAIDAAGPFLSALTPEEPLLTWTNYFKVSPVPAVEEIAALDWAEMRLPALSLALWLGALVIGWRLARRPRSRARLLAAGLAVVALAVLGLATLSLGTLAVSRPAALRVAMSDEQAAALTQQMLANVYRAFDFRGESQVYDRLAKTVDGPVLERIYLDQRRTLRVARAGGAEARVKSVEVMSAVAAPVEGSAAAFRVRAKWTIYGTVGHWGHVHQRRNLYEADLVISGASGAWKFTDFEVLDQERVALR
jgi:hypothetical protein